MAPLRVLSQSQATHPPVQPSQEDPIRGGGKLEFGEVLKGLIVKES